MFPRSYYLLVDVAILVHRYFLESFETDRLIWSSVYPLHEPSISERYSHCACFYNKIMYVFGGCTAMNTTFNDLWAFDIAAEKWVRCLASGRNLHCNYSKCALLTVYSRADDFFLAVESNKTLFLFQRRLPISEGLRKSCNVQRQIDFVWRLELPYTVSSTSG